MSTKTSIKRIALVAVAALGLGMVSTVAANAGTTGACTVWTVHTSGVTSSINLAEVAANTDVQGTAIGVNVGAALTAMAATGDTTNCASQQFAAYISSAPAGGMVGVTSAAATTPTTQTGTSINVTSPVLNVRQTTTEVATTASTVTATGAVGYGKFVFTPTKAGTYVLTVWNDLNQDGVYQNTEVAQTKSITVSAAATLAPAASIVRMAESGLAVTAQNATSDAAYTTTKDAIARSASVGATAATRNAIAQVEVILLNNDGTAASNLHTVNASISGAGLAVIDNSGTANTTGGGRAATYTLTGTDNIAVVHLITDGTTGSGTVTISVTDSVTGVTTVVGTKSFTTYGSVAKLAVSTANFTIGRAGYTSGAASTTRAAATEFGVTSTITPYSSTVTTPALIIKATDSNGNPVTTAAVPTVTSSDATVVTGGTCVLDAGSATYGSSVNGVGYYNCSYTTAAAAASGSSATLTFKVLDPADVNGLAYLTVTQKITVGGKASTGKETLTFDSSSYSPGQGMTVTLKCVDVSGNPCYDGAASPAVTFNKSTGGSAIAASYYVGGVVTSDDSLGNKTVFAPVSGGSFSGTATAASLATLTASATVVDANATATTDAIAGATDAANEATDAANAATDAANAAAEAADAATAAAQDAQAAVAALASQVADLISGIKAQITALTNLVIKIQKKVKA